MSASPYIVAFHRPEEGTAFADVLAPLQEKVTKSGGSIKHVYTSKVMLGFAGTFNEDVKKELESHPAVKYVEPDGAVSTQ